MVLEHINRLRSVYGLSNVPILLMPENNMYATVTPLATQFYESGLKNYMVMHATNGGTREGVRTSYYTKNMLGTEVWNIVANRRVVPSREMISCEMEKAGKPAREAWHSIVHQMRNFVAEYVPTNTTNGVEKRKLHGHQCPDDYVMAMFMTYYGVRFFSEFRNQVLSTPLNHTDIPYNPNAPYNPPDESMRWMRAGGNW